MTNTEKGLLIQVELICTALKNTPEFAERFWALMDGVKDLRQCDEPIEPPS